MKFIKDFSFNKKSTRSPKSEIKKSNFLLDYFPPFQITQLL